MYFKDLTAKEKRHLKSQDIRTLKKFKEVAEHQAKTREYFPKWSEPCWDCRAIAKKLGLPV